MNFIKKILQNFLSIFNLRITKIRINNENDSEEKIFFLNYLILLFM